MTTFTGGPADKVTMTLRRAPIFLRVCHTPQRIDHPWDALDQPADEPRPGERIYVYIRAGQPMTGFIDYRGKGGRREGSAFMSAKYRYLDAQPAEDVLCDRQKWQAWCIDQAKTITQGEGQTNVGAAKPQTLFGSSEQTGLPDVQSAQAAQLAVQEAPAVITAQQLWERLRAADGRELLATLIVLAELTKDIAATGFIFHEQGPGMSMRITECPIELKAGQTVRIIGAWEGGDLSIVDDLSKDTGCIRRVWPAEGLLINCRITPREGK